MIAKPITDSDWPLTGTIDKRVGGPPIQGRKDFFNRLKKKGLVPLTHHDLRDDSTPSPPTKETIKKELDKVF